MSKRNSMTGRYVRCETHPDLVGLTVKDAMEKLYPRMTKPMDEEAAQVKDQRG